MTNFCIFHNPRCSKSRQALQLLQDKGCEVEVIEYLKTPPSAEQLRNIVNMLGMSSVRDLLRENEPEYEEYDLSDPNLKEDQLIEIILDNPRLIERPIVIKDGKAKIGRPPESVLDLL
jgi:arsenate reductase (glutaredoxin)